MPNDTITSKANLLEWRKGTGTKLLDTLHLPDALQHWMGVVERAGVPFVPSAQNAREEAIVLLQVGAEVEHALLLQYLFAAYSLTNDFPIDPAHPETGSWQATLVRIAKQEMAHLITVQNLLLALNANMHFDREDFPLYPSLYPFPVRLEAVSQESLAKYVAAEMPPLDLIKDTTLRAHVSGILKQANVAIHQDVQRVGMVYAHLYWLFRKTDTPQPGEPWADLPADPNFSPWHIADEDFAPPQVLANSSIYDDWDLSPGDNGMHVDQVTSTFPTNPDARRLSALNALFTIAAQGEGPATQHDSHFERFLRLYDSFKSLPAGAVLPVAPNPSTTSDPQAGSDPQARSVITEPTSLLLAKLLDVRYEFLLICLIRGVQESQVGVPPATRSKLLHWAVNEMTPTIQTLAMTLAASKLTSGAGSHAGAPFELLHGPLPQEPLTQWARLKKLVEKSDRLLTALGKATTDPLGVTTLDDPSRRAFIDAQVQGILNTPLPD